MKFIPVLFAIAMLVTPAFAAEAPKTQCMTQTNLLGWAGNRSLVVYTLTPEGQEKLRKYVNTNRSKRGLELLNETSQFVWVPGVDPMNAGVTYFQDGCARDDMTMLMDSNTQAIMFHSAGVKEEDIIKLVIA